MFTLLLLLPLLHFLGVAGQRSFPLRQSNDIGSMGAGFSAFAASDGHDDLVARSAWRIPTILTAIEYGDTYTVPVDIGSQSFDLLLDTGSANTWVVRPDFQALSPSNYATVSQVEAGIPDRYTITREISFTAYLNRLVWPDLDSTFLFADAYDNTTVEGVAVATNYGVRGGTIGILGTDSMQVAMKTVPKAYFSAVNEAAIRFDGDASGILGMARSAVTTAFSGNAAGRDKKPSIYNGLDTSTPYPYDSIIDTMFKDVAPSSKFFTLALERSSCKESADGGSFVIGGIPPMLPTTWSKTPFIVLENSSNPAAAKTVQAYYAVGVEGASVNGRLDAAKFTASVDSGTPWLILPPALAESINSAFTPKGTYDPNGIMYFDKAPTAPRLSLKIGGTSYLINAKDLVRPDDEGRYISRVYQASPGQPNILGSPFLKNVYAVFDLAQDQLHLAPHVYP